MELCLSSFIHDHTIDPKAPSLPADGVTDDADVLQGVRGEHQGAEHGCAFRSDTDNSSLASLALESNFALICPEASRFEPNTAQPSMAQTWTQDLITEWEIPPVMNQDTLTPCTDEDSRDLAFIDHILSSLDPTRFDLKRVYFAGESAGGAMALYAATCSRQRSLVHHVQAVAVHSSGLKVKGDGVKWPNHWSDLSETGECIDCEYFPMVPLPATNLTNMKLCLFDGTNDFVGSTNFTHGSKALVSKWPDTGGTVEEHWHQRGHCFIVKWDQILDCLSPGMSAGS